MRSSSFLRSSSINYHKSSSTPTCDFVHCLSCVWQRSYLTHIQMNHHIIWMPCHGTPLCSEFTGLWLEMYLSFSSQSQIYEWCLQLWNKICIVRLCYLSFIKCKLGKLNPFRLSSSVLQSIVNRVVLRSVFLVGEPELNIWLCVYDVCVVHSVTFKCCTVYRFCNSVRLPWLITVMLTWVCH